MTSDGPTLAVERAAEVCEETAVRHVDQLSASTREGLRELADGERRAVAGLEPGEVIVSVSYYRVVRAEATASESETTTVRA
ncbi:MAG: hypothetical protein ABEH80_02370 [Halobaculum sp.]